METRNTKGALDIWRKSSSWMGEEDIWHCLQEEEVKRSQAGVFMDHARKVGGSQSQVQERARKRVAIKGDQRCIHMSPQNLVTWTSAVGLAGR